MGKDDSIRSVSISGQTQAPMHALPSSSDPTNPQSPLQRFHILGKSQSFPPSKVDNPFQGRSQGLPSSSCPPYGSKSVIGRRAKMEDACVAVPYLIEVPLQAVIDELLPPRIAPQLRSSSGSSRSSDAPGSTAVAMSSHNNDGNRAAISESSVHQRSPRGDRAAKARKEQQQSEAALGSSFAASIETLHFFGVFDGHGGADAAMHCAKTLHERVKEVFSVLTAPTVANAEQGTERNGEVDGSLSSGKGGAPGVQTSSLQILAPIRTGSQSRSVSDYVDAAPELYSASSGSSFLDAVDMDEPSSGGEKANVSGSGGILEGVYCTTETVEAALTKAFHLTDEEFGELGGYEHLALVGTTAVVALVGTRMIYVANCGDSRAVLCRAGQAIPLSDDHKAAREDETARVEAAGGQILFWNGVRVMGLLAVSRAIGDHSLRPYVIAEPEVTIVNRHQGDELLVMASDGLWDVMSNQEACTLAKKCLMRARQRGSSRQSAARVAATVLTRAAVDRGSRDNVTVVIVDLTPESADEQPSGGLLHEASLDAGSTHLTPVDSRRSSGGADDDRGASSHVEYSAVPASTSAEESRSHPAVAPVPSPFDMPKPTGKVDADGFPLVRDAVELSSPFQSGDI